MACGMATGKAWFKVPSAIKFVLTGKLNKYVSGKDVILHIIGKIGVDGALYKSMEFTGEGVKSLTIYDRLTISNMAIEAGAKNGIFEVDEETLAYVNGRAQKPYTVYKADPDAQYDETYEIDLSEIKSTVAFPHLPENTHTIDDVGDIKIDQIVIGSCTNGQYKEPLKLDAKYNLAGYNYTLRDLGDGFAMFDGAVNVLDYVMEDYMVLANYVKSFENGKVTGYEQPKGNITILTAPAEEPVAPAEPVAPVTPAEPASETYVVVAGDCLWSIAAKKLGSGAKWTAIYEANKDIITNSALIYVGQTLKLP